VDFGLVKRFRDSTRGGERLTSATHIAGTPDYMSPETALGKNDVDRRSDIYSLGCVAYWMLTGKPVFEAKSPLEIALNHVETLPVPPSKRTERVIPRDLEHIVLECLSKDPRQRPQTASGLSDRLAALGIEGSWTRRHATSWWRDHAPAAPPESPATDFALTDSATNGKRYEAARS
jgi:eukaryotic-like serine/threonine-protein kinase